LEIKKIVLDRRCKSFGSSDAAGVGGSLEVTAPSLGGGRREKVYRRKGQT